MARGHPVQQRVLDAFAKSHPETILHVQRQTAILIRLSFCGMLAYSMVGQYSV